jgi:hypothetical protein
MNILERIRRCNYCGRNMMQRTARSYRENPYCSACLGERMKKATDAVGPIVHQRIGAYLAAIPASEIASSGGPAPDCA